MTVVNIIVHVNSIRWSHVTTGFVRKCIVHCTHEIHWSMIIISYLFECLFLDYFRLYPIFRQFQFILRATCFGAWSFVIVKRTHLFITWATSLHSQLGCTSDVYHQRIYIYVYTCIYTIIHTYFDKMMIPQSRSTFVAPFFWGPL